MMADREAMRALVEQAYAERASGSIEGVMAAFHADAVFELAGDTKVLHLAGAARSHPNVREAMTQFIGAFEFIKRDIIAFIADDDRAAVHSRLTMRFIPKDTTFTTELTDLFKFQDGKIIELVEFADTALIKEITSA
jgi:ketosteroid isomerase-like protein